MKNIEVINLITDEIFCYSLKQISVKKALINTWIIEEIGVTQLHNKIVRKNTESKIIEGERTLAIGDYCVMKNA